MNIAFGGEKHERLEIIVAGYERAVSGDYDDDNWLRVTVSVAAGAFRGSFDATFQAVELLDLCTGLSGLYDTLSGCVKFETLENQLSLDFTGNGRGSIELLGEALDQVGIGNKLSFALQLDQSQLYQSVQALKAAVAAFPVRT
jgi:hypothetical protein